MNRRKKWPQELRDRVAILVRKGWEFKRIWKIIETEFGPNMPSGTLTEGAIRGLIAEARRQLLSTGGLEKPTVVNLRLID